MMKDGASAESWYAYHAYHAHGMLPSDFFALSRQEKAVIEAFIDIKLEAQERADRRAKRK